MATAVRKLQSVLQNQRSRAFYSSIRHRDSEAPEGPLRHERVSVNTTYLETLVDFVAELLFGFESCVAAITVMVGPFLSTLLPVIGPAFVHRLFVLHTCRLVRGRVRDLRTGRNVCRKRKAGVRWVRKT